MFTLLDSISHNYSYAKLHLTFYYCFGKIEEIKEVFMTEENVPDTHKLLEYLDVLVMEYNGKFQIFFKLPDLYRLLTSKDFDDFANYKKDLEEIKETNRFFKKNYAQSLSRIARPHCQRMHGVLKKQFDSFIIIKGLYGVQTRYYKIEDFNEIVNIILQENLIDTSLPFTPTINQRKVKSFAKKNIETLRVKILEESIVNTNKNQ